MADFFCSETADSKNICILYDNAAALILSITTRIARQKNKKTNSSNGSGACFLKSSEDFSGLKCQPSNWNPLVLESWSFNLFFNIWKTKRIAKFDGREPWRCEDLNRIATSQNRHKDFGDVWERGPRSNFLRSVPPGTSGHYNFVQASSQKSLSCIL